VKEREERRQKKLKKKSTFICVVEIYNRFIFYFFYFFEQQRTTQLKEPTKIRNRSYSAVVCLSCDGSIKCSATSGRG
jgi:hypothetical protein